MPRVRSDLVERQERGGFVTVAEASRRSGVCERTIRSWTRNGTLIVRRVGPMLVFVDVASLKAVAGLVEAETDDQILADIAAPRKAPAAIQAPLRELTFERDE